MKWMLLTALALSGCTAGRATYYVIDAQQKYQDALAQGAEKHAAYEITMAREYLAKAKEESGYSDYGATEQLCKKSMEFSAAAYAKASDVGDDIEGADQIVPEEKKEKEKVEEDKTKIDLEGL